MTYIRGFTVTLYQPCLSQWPSTIRWWDICQCSDDKVRVLFKCMGGKNTFFLKQFKGFFWNNFFVSYLFLCVFQDTVEAFLKRKLKDEPDIEGRTAFMWAAGKGADNVIKKFIEYGMDIHCTDKNGGTGKDVIAVARRLWNSLGIV